MQDFPSPKRVALYARVSSEEQREGQTIDSQVAELERFAQQSTWAITGVYKDEGWSGGILARPELDRLRDDAPKGLFNAVLLNDVDRLARDVTHLGVIKRDLERKGIQVIFRKLPAESSPTHNLMVNILGSFAEFERELIADRTRRGKRHKVEVRQLFLGSIAPYGFRYVRKDRAAGKEGMLEIDSEEAAVVRQMFEWVDQDGLSARKVVTRLTQRGIPPRKGSLKWARSSVLRILRSEVYTGVWHYNKYESCEPKNPIKNRKYRRSPKSSTRKRERREWLPVSLPEQLRIVHKDVWQRVQRQLDQNFAFSLRNSKHAYLLRGLVRCTGCGARFVGEPRHGKFYYRCYARCKKVSTVKEEDLDEVVWKSLREAIMNPKALVENVTTLNRARIAQADAARSEITDVEKPLQKIQGEENRLLEAYRVGIISAGQLGKELEKLNARRSSIEVRKAALTESTQRLPLSVVERSVHDYCRALEQQLDSANVEERQRLLRLLIEEIAFDGSGVKIRGLIPLALSGRPPEVSPGVTNSDDSSFGRIATTEIETCVLNALNTSVEKQQDFGNETQNFPVCFALEQAITKILLPTPRGIDGRFLGRKELIWLVLRQLLALRALKAISRQ